MADSHWEAQSKLAVGVKVGHSCSNRDNSANLGLSDAIKWWFWIGILIKFFADTAQICSPLLVKVFQDFSFYPSIPRHLTTT